MRILTEEQKQARKIYKAQWYRENAARIAEDAKLRRQTDGDGIRARERAGRRRNSEAKKARDAAYYRANSEKIKLATNNYYENQKKSNPEKILALGAKYTAKRRAAMRKAAVVWANKLEIQKIYEESVAVSLKTGVQHEVDHVVPLTNRLVCGLHCEANLQVVPMILNRSKHNRQWPDMP